MKKIKQLFDIMNIDCELDFQNEIVKITIDGATWWENINESNWIYRFREIAYRAGYYSDPFDGEKLIIGKNGIKTIIDLTGANPVRKDFFENWIYSNQSGYKE